MHVLTLVMGYLFHSSLKMAALSMKICLSITDKILFYDIVNSPFDLTGIDTTDLASIDSSTASSSRFQCFKNLFLSVHNRKLTERERASWPVCSSA